MMPHEYDEVWITVNDDGTFDWTWIGNTGRALVQKEVLESLLEQVAEYRRIW